MFFSRLQKASVGTLPLQLHFPLMDEFMSSAPSPRCYLSGALNDRILDSAVGNGRFDSNRNRLMRFELPISSAWSSREISSFVVKSAFL
jgi:hypothetical protein